GRGPSVVTREGAVVHAIFEPTGSSSLEQFSAMPIPIFGSSPRASGGSREGGRGIGREDL
ncbi:MAG: hypothetical protein WBH57_03815, partial [Anaerolineae bacterium]